jgi:hypothetical protein
MPLSWAGACVICLPLSLALGGCGSPEAASAASTAARFVDLVSDDPAAACGMLAPRTRDKVAEDGDDDCAEGLRSAELSSASSSSDVPPEVAGHTALVTTGGQTLFLTLFDDGWKVFAAGCTRSSDDEAVPYDCALEGG